MSSVLKAVCELRRMRMKNTRKKCPTTSTDQVVIMRMPGQLGGFRKKGGVKKRVEEKGGGGSGKVSGWIHQTLFP